MIHGDAVAVFNQNAVVREHAREALVGGGQRHGPLQRRAIAVDDEVAKSDSAAVAAAQYRPAVKVGSGAKRAMVANNSDVVRAFG